MVLKLMVGCGINNRKLYVFMDIMWRIVSLIGWDGGIKLKLVVGCGMWDVGLKMFLLKFFCMILLF